MHASNGNGHSLPALWRWLAVTMVGVVGVMVAMAWQNLRETQRSVTRELRQQVVDLRQQGAKHEAELTALKERLGAVEWYVKGRMLQEKP